MRFQIERFFRRQGWTPHRFQRDTWEAQAENRSGLIQVPTGSGKTYAAFGGAIERLAQPGGNGLRVLYITPLRAMTRDLESALRHPVDALGLDATVESRTGDTSSSRKARQRRKLPEVLLTTPESLTLLLTYAGAAQLFRNLALVIVDEWHELLAGKRGTQVELALARLRGWCPYRPCVWGMTATLANPEQALDHLAPDASGARHITEGLRRPVRVTSLLPDDIRRIPWAGNTGLRLRDTLVDALDPAYPTLIFTNTRSQAENWHAAITAARPDWAPLAGLHHGSLDRSAREALEHGIRDGTIRLIVATSSLDLGVDFSPIRRIVQIGSPKGVARFLQRAGRGNHSPGATAEIRCLPASVLHPLEFAAVRSACERNAVEAVEPPREPLDALCQHLVTCAAGDGFDPDALFREIRSTRSYAELTRERFDWALALVAEGGKTLSAYDAYRRLRRDDRGRYTVRTPALAKRHRMAVGTITADSMVSVRFFRGKRIGQVEESFAARLKRGERFFFGGQALECRDFRDMTLYVRTAKSGGAAVPRWMGGRMPLSTELGTALRRILDAAARGDETEGPEELRALAPVLATQRTLSAIPREHDILFETCQTREGCHGFCFTFEGRRVNDGRGALLAYRMSRLRTATFTVTPNDYGIEWLSPGPFPFERVWRDHPELLEEGDLAGDILESVHLGELAKRQFRGVARVAGLTFEGYPGARKSGRQLQASSGLLYDVFARFDPDNALLRQARDEVLEGQFEETRLRATLRRMRNATLRFHHTGRPTPLSLPLMTDRLSSRLSSESIADRVARVQQQWLDTRDAESSAHPATSA